MVTYQHDVHDVPHAPFPFFAFRCGFRDGLSAPDEHKLATHRLTRGWQTAVRRLMFIVSYLKYDPLQGQGKV